MKDKNSEKEGKDEELSLNKENRISTNTFDNITGQGEKKPYIGDTKELTTIDINSNNVNTKATKGKRKKS